MKIGIFGGSFDPIHLGHLWIAESAMEELSLDQLRWIPAATSPLKPNGPVASEEQRCEMLRLAIAGREGQIVDDCEIQRDGVSYTVDTVALLQDALPGNEWFLIIGSDSLTTMRQWHEPERLLAIVTLAVVQRGGECPIDFDVLEEIVTSERTDLFRRNVIKMPVIEISSSEIRNRIGQGRGVRYRIPRAVEAYLHANKIYT